MKKLMTMVITMLMVCTLGMAQSPAQTTSTGAPQKQAQVKKSKKSAKKANKSKKKASKKRKGRKSPKPTAAPTPAAQ
jgi:hypothetical protein